MRFTVQQYIELPPLSFPLALKTGYTISEFAGECCKCGGRLIDLRGSVREFENCSDMNFVGRCQPCKAIVTCHFRYYRDGRFEEERNGCWSRMGKTTWLSRLGKLLQKLTGK